MRETPEQEKLSPPTEQLGWREFFFEVLHGMGEMAGLALLWSLEEVRNVYFRTLDRLNVKARPSRRVSAFPPGSPRRRKAA